MRFRFGNDVILVERSVVDWTHDRRQTIARRHESLTFPLFALVHGTLHDA